MTDQDNPFQTGLWLGFDDLEAHASSYDALVAQTVDIDHFCSSSDWILPARSAFAPVARPFAMARPDAAVALMRLDADSGHDIAVPLEAGWGLASPFVGPDPGAQADLLATMVASEARPPDAMFLSGLVRDGPVQRAIVRRFMGRYRIGIGPPAGRRTTAIRGGVDGFLAARSSKFRANLRRARRRAKDAGFHFAYERGTAQTTARLMAIEANSWKGRAGQGVDSGAPRTFYDEMLARLVARGALRVVWVTQGAIDVAYCMGGIFGDAYRGLQVSFTAGQERWSPGNLAQLEMIRGLADDGVRTYHLGMEIPYKSSWAEPGLETITLALLPP